MSPGIPPDTPAFDVRARHDACTKHMSAPWYVEVLQEGRRAWGGWVWGWQVFGARWTSAMASSLRQDPSNLLEDVSCLMTQESRSAAMVQTWPPGIRA